MEFAQKATKDAKRWGTNSEGQVKYCRCTFFGHATPDRAGARPYRVQCRVARCDMGLRWPARAVAINRQIPGPLVTVIQQRGRNSTRCRRLTSHLSPLTSHLSPLTSHPFTATGAHPTSETLTAARAAADPGAAVRVTLSRCEKGPEPVGESGPVRSH